MYISIYFQSFTFISFQTDEKKFLSLHSKFLEVLELYTEKKK